LFDSTSNQLINILRRLGHTMDTQDYDKIVDKLMQFRGKLPDVGQLRHHMARMTTDDMKNKIDRLLMYIDEYAKLDSAGWIK